MISPNNNQLLCQWFHNIPSILKGNLEDEFRFPNLEPDWVEILILQLTLQWELSHFSVLSIPICRMRTIMHPYVVLYIWLLEPDTQVGA